MATFAEALIAKLTGAGAAPKNVADAYKASLEAEQAFIKAKAASAAIDGSTPRAEALALQRAERLAYTAAQTATQTYTGINGTALKTALADAKYQIPDPTDASKFVDVNVLAAEVKVPQKPTFHPTTGAEIPTAPLVISVEEHINRFGKMPDVALLTTDQQAAATKYLSAVMPDIEAAKTAAAAGLIPAAANTPAPSADTTPGTGVKGIGASIANTFKTKGATGKIAVVGGSASIMLGAALLWDAFRGKINQETGEKYETRTGQALAGAAAIGGGVLALGWAARVGKAGAPGAAVTAPAGGVGRG